MSDENSTTRTAAGAHRFGIVDASVIEDPTVTVRAKVVYTLLAVHADKAGQSTPGRRRMATMLDVSLDTIDRALADLRAAGILTWEQRRGSGDRLLSNEYTLHHNGAPRALRGAAAAFRDTPPSRTSAATPQPHQSGHPSRTSAATPSRTSAAENSTNMNNTTEQVAPAAADAPTLDLHVVPDTVLKDPLPEIARALTGEWWERFTPRPTANYVGQRKIVLRLLEAGWTADQVRAALRGVTPPLTLAYMERRLRGAGAQGNLIPAHDWQPGEQFGATR